MFLFTRSWETIYLYKVFFFPKVNPAWNVVLSKASKPNLAQYKWK